MNQELIEAHHQIADIEAERTLRLRKMRQALGLAEVALLALEANRTHVTQEYLERIIETLKESK